MAIKTLGINGWDHDLSQRSTICISELMQKWKTASSNWVHEELRVPEVWWQEGYAAFTVSHSALKQVATYIRNQETHHQKTTFKKEYLAFLKKHGIDFDERYVFD